MSGDARPAFYALAPGGWRDYVTLLHPPYTLWHLSYVAIGAALAPALDWRRLGVALLAFGLALGIGAHALDELHGRPLRTRIPAPMLVALAGSSMAVAVALGVGASLLWTPWLLPFVVFGGFIVAAYNLELFGGRFHGDLWFGLAWGALPLLSAYVVTAETLSLAAVGGAVFATALSLAQRGLSTQVRTVRRSVTAVSGAIVHADGTEEVVSGETLTRAPEQALRLLTVAVAALAAALLLVHLD